jgi:hypothetical protein
MNNNFPPINVYASYTVGNNSYNIEALDVQNPSSSAVTLNRVSIMTPSTNCTGQFCTTSYKGYPVNTGAKLYPKGGYYQGVGVAQPRSTTTISLIPSGFNGNPNNTFLYNITAGLMQSIKIRIGLNDASTGFIYPEINGFIP